jgi:hypothetical protein
MSTEPALVLVQKEVFDPRFPLIRWGLQAYLIFYGHGEGFASHVEVVFDGRPMIFESYTG